MMQRNAWWLIVLLWLGSLPGAAQTVTGTLANIVTMMPGGGGWPAVMAEAQRESGGKGQPKYTAGAGAVTFDGEVTVPYDAKLAIFTCEAVQGKGAGGASWDFKDSTGAEPECVIYVCRIERLVNGKWVRIADIV